MALIKFQKGDTLIMKKKHPCSCDRFTVLRTGTDIRILCQGCQRDVTVDRISLEKSIKKVLPQEQSEIKEDK